MQTRSSFIVNLIKVVFSNIIVLLSGALASFIIPKLMGVTQYGYYRVFMLYAVYASLLHFGFVDGILLKFGGYEYDQLNLNKFRTLTSFFLTFELVIGCVFILIALLLPSSVYKFICIYLGVYTIAINIVTYFQYLTQAVMKFSLLARMNAFQPIFTVIIISVFWISIHYQIMVNLKYQQYLFWYVLSFFIVMIVYLWIYRSMIIGPRVHLIEVQSEIIEIFKTGIVITISYQIGALIFNLDNQYILFFFNTRTFSNYSFAYSMIQVLTTIINAISTVLFPYLNRQKIEKSTSKYQLNMSYMLITIFLALIAYYPIHWIVHLYLPAYVDSLNYFRILLPGVALSNCIYAIIFNYYKVLKQIYRYFVYGIVILIFAIIINYLAYLCFKSPFAIAISSLIVLLTWFMVTNLFLLRHYHISYSFNTLYLISMIILFEIVSEIKNPWISLVIYIIAYCIVTLLLQRKTISKLVRSIVHKEAN